jgi:uncharacterized NAD(P)/FAD-binding protein YdhS
MGAFPDRPDDFLSWLQARPQIKGCDAPVAGTFVPRRLYGDYLGSLLASAADQAGASSLKLVNDDAVGLEVAGGKVVVTLGSGARLWADSAVLAIGNFAAPPVCPGVDDCSMWRASPWQDGALSGIDPTGRVLLVGTGLTMVDATIALLDAGHTGPIHGVSRRGLLPRIHPATPVAAATTVQAYPIRLAALTRLLRQEAERAEAEGRPWQSVIDAIRPVTQDLWQAMSLDDKRRFLRHVRCWWDIFRHRMAPSVAERIHAAEAAGQLRITAGRIVHCEADRDRMDILVRARGSNEPVPLRVARAINCTGVMSDITRSDDPLLKSLLSQQMIRPDALSLGLDVDVSCAVLNQDGGISDRLFAIGPITKGRFWEIVAVPDIRRQCEALAQLLVAQGCTD